MLNEGALWLVFLISFLHQGEVGKHLMTAQGRGRMFRQALGRGEMQRGWHHLYQESSRRHLVNPGKGLIRERRAEQCPGCREVSGTAVPQEAQAPACAPFPTHSLKVNGGKDGGDANKEKSAWIGAPHAACVVGNGYGASALVWPQNMCSCMPHIWHAAI